MAASPAIAATSTWTGASSVTWATTGNWNNGVPATGDTAVFGAAASNDLNIDIGSGITVNSIVFSSALTTTSTHSITAGSGSITINDGGSIAYQQRAVSPGTAGAAQTISRPIVLSGSATFTNNNSTGASNGDILVLSGTITGSGPITITGTASGASFVRISANNTSTFTGSWDLRSGNLSANNNGALGTSSSVTLNGGILRLESGITVSRPVTYASSSSSISFLNTASTLSGDITLNSGIAATFNTGGGNGGVISGRILGDSTNNITINHGLFGNALTLSGAGSNTASGTTTIATGGVYALAKTGGATAIAGNLTVNPNTSGTALVRWDGSNQVADASIIVLSSSAAATRSAWLRLNGQSDTIGGLASAGSGTCYVENEKNATVGTLTLNVASGTSYTFAGILRDGTSGTAGVLAIGMAGSGTQVLSSSNTFTGGATIQGGVLKLGHSSALGTGTATLSGGTLDLGGLSTATNAVVLTGGTLTNGTVAVTQVSATSGLISANLTGSGVLSKSGAGTLALSGSNDFTGGTTLAGGVLAVNAAWALGTGTLTITSGTLDNTSGGAVVNANANSQAWNGNFAFAGSASLDLGGGAVTLGGDRTVTVSASTLTVGGSIGGGFGLTKAGAGTLALGGTNGYSGATVVSAGTLSLLTASAIPAASAVSLSAGVLDVSSIPTSSVTIASLSGSSGAVVSLGAKNLTIDNVGVATYFGEIGGSGGLTKQGSGKLLLEGANSYTGATAVNAGTLAVNGSLASTALNVAAGATLMGSGSIAGNTTILGAHMPGNSPGIETFGGNLTYSGGAASVTWELWGNTTTQGSPTAIYDQIVVGGNLDFTGATTLNLLFSSGGSVNWTDTFWDTDHQWVIYDVVGTTSNFGNLTLVQSNWADASSNVFQTARSQASFSVIQSGNDVVLAYAAVPEPGTLALAGIGMVLAGLAVAQRRVFRGRA